MEKRKSFVLYSDYGNIFGLLSDKEAGRVIKAVFNFVNGEELPGLSGGALILFTVLKNTLEQDLEKYRAVCERNRKNGKLGGRPRREPSQPNGPPQETGDFSKTAEQNIKEEAASQGKVSSEAQGVKTQKSPKKRFLGEEVFPVSKTQKNQKKPRKPDSDNDIDLDHDNDNESERKQERPEKQFFQAFPPTPKKGEFLSLFWKKHWERVGTPMPRKKREKRAVQRPPPEFCLIRFAFPMS